jgi:SAM-dependent methyltransferase
MGTSNWQNISYCIELIRELSPRSVLDIGAGYGRWGILCREFLDVWEGRTYPESWTTRIDGVEGFPRNISEYHHYFYSSIECSDAASWLGRLQFHYDLVILGDVLEHFEQDAGREVLEKCLTKSNYVLLSIPLGLNWPQDTRDNNDFERHRSVWHARDFSGPSLRARKIFRDYIGRPFGVFLLSRDDEFRFSRGYRKAHFHRLLSAAKRGLKGLRGSAAKQGLG